jgi:hypothetical protein
MHPLAQYVDLIALLAYLLDPLALFSGHLTKRRKMGQKKMLTEFQFARSVMFFHHLRKTIAGAHIHQ